MRLRQIFLNISLSMTVVMTVAATSQATSSAPYLKSQGTESSVFRAPAGINPNMVGTHTSNDGGEYLMNYCLDSNGNCVQNLFPKDTQFGDQQIRSGKCAASSVSHPYPYSSGFSQDNYSVNLSCSPF